MRSPKPWSSRLQLALHWPWLPRPQRCFVTLALDRAASAEVKSIESTPRDEVQHEADPKPSSFASEENHSVFGVVTTAVPVFQSRLVVRRVSS
jgi:hypothetical protein